MFLKEIDPVIQGLADIGCGLDFNAGSFGKFIHVFREALLLDIHGLVRTEGRADQKTEILLGGQLLMPFQRIGRIIGSADIFHIGLLNDAADGQVGVLLEHLAGFIPDFPGILGSQGLVDAEISLQLEVAPVVHRISDGHFQSFCKCKELVIWIGISRYKIFRDSV